MLLDDALKSVAVLGAGGKMGRGIALLLLQEMARLEANECASVEGTHRQLFLIDPYETDLRQYLTQQLTRYGERNINQLRRYYSTDSELISNEQIITSFVEGALSLVIFDTVFSPENKATLIFEAVVENIETKTKVINSVRNNNIQQFFFTNTSSIPIHVLRKQTGLDGFLIGVHFYNPPTVQKLIELIAPPTTHVETKQLAIDLANRLGKIMVESADVVGFIGNGYFMREILFACEQVHKLSKRLPEEEAIYLIDYVTRDFLIRPMGIFQLIDFVGITVVRNILNMMRTYLNDEQFQDSLLYKYNTFFQYEAGKPIAIYANEQFRPFGPWCNDIKHALGELPPQWQSWKKLSNDPDKDVKIEDYFAKLFESKIPGAEVALDFLEKSKAIAEELVRNGVAKSLTDVNTVLRNGFYYLYDVEKGINHVTIK